MRAAAFFSASLIAIGLYVVIAAALAFTPSWIGIGILLIAAVAAISLVATERSAASVRG